MTRLLKYCQSYVKYVISLRSFCIERAAKKRFDLHLKLL